MKTENGRVGQLIVVLDASDHITGGHQLTMLISLSLLQFGSIGKRENSSMRVVRIVRKEGRVVMMMRMVVMMVIVM